jgi:hypothetical protein
MLFLIFLPGDWALCGQCCKFQPCKLKIFEENQVFGHKKSEKSTGIFPNTDFGREKNPLTWNTYIYQQKKFSKSVAPELYKLKIFEDI